LKHGVFHDKDTRSVAQGTAILLGKPMFGLTETLTCATQFFVAVASRSKEARLPQKAVPSAEAAEPQSRVTTCTSKPKNAHGSYTPPKEANLLLAMSSLS